MCSHELCIIVFRRRCTYLNGKIFLCLQCIMMSSFPRIESTVCKEVLLCKASDTQNCIPVMTNVLLKNLEMESRSLKSLQRCTRGRMFRRLRSSASSQAAHKQACTATFTLHMFTTLQTHYQRLGVCACDENSIWCHGGDFR